MVGFPLLFASSTTLRRPLLWWNMADTITQSAHCQSDLLRGRTFRSTSLGSQPEGRRAATVSSESGGCIALTPHIFRMLVNDQKVSGNSGYTRRTFMQSPDIDHGSVV